MPRLTCASVWVSVKEAQVCYLSTNVSRQYWRQTNSHLYSSHEVDLRVWFSVDTQEEQLLFYRIKNQQPGCSSCV